ncbi:hypothetical protein E2P81_ATG04314 [Venturia nashicola]|nr:hypothetical protein E2P81_ATG04314 [Venturia nashicola]
MVVYELKEEARDRMEEASECRLEEQSECFPNAALEEDGEAQERKLFWEAIVGLRASPGIYDMIWQGFPNTASEDDMTAAGDGVESLVTGRHNFTWPASPGLQPSVRERLMVGKRHYTVVPQHRRDDASILASTAASGR